MVGRFWWLGMGALAIALVAAAPDASARLFRFHKSKPAPAVEDPAVGVPPAPRQPPPRYHFSVDSLEIGDTGNPDADTDYIAVRMTGQPNAVEALGAIGKGVHDVGIAFDAPVAAKSRVTLSYVVLNTGKPAAAIVGYLKRFAFNIGMLAGQNWSGLLTGICDGVVAKGEHSFSGAELERQTANGNKIGGRDATSGPHAASGCGPTSHYWVNWSISAG